jgi:bifunctional enzyme CysN/CysC
MIDPRPLLRVATCGSVDDGKSTFIGRLLYETGAILEDHLAAVEVASRKSGEQETNLALLTDGLRDERAQKITIDVAYRHFSTKNRRFLLADTPGHAQYTRNMFTGVSTADVAILLVDAERGLTEQSLRHAFIVDLLRVPSVILAVNKMDTVAYDEAVFRNLVADFQTKTSRLRHLTFRTVPISAKSGDNVARRSEQTSWYQGPSVLEILDEQPPYLRQNEVDLRFVVQLPIGPNAKDRQYLGTCFSGRLKEGERLRVLPTGHEVEVRRITSAGSSASSVCVGEAASIALGSEVDLSRGDVLVRPKNLAAVANLIDSNVCWMSETPCEVPMRVIVQIGTKTCSGSILQIHHRFQLSGFHREATNSLDLNDLARVEIATDAEMPCDEFDRQTGLGAGILIHPVTSEVLGAFTIQRTDRRQRTAAGKGLVLWMTGLSGAGKSTLSDAATEKLRHLGHYVVQLDGDALRSTLNRDLGFSESDRTENIRRAASMARLLSDQGATVICSLISPLNSQRDLAREIIGPMFRLIYVECSLAEAENRDPKGLYKRARIGEITEFTGISSRFEPPLLADLTLTSERSSVGECLNTILTFVASI